VPTVSLFASLLARLRAAPEETFRATCTEILSAPLNWASVVRDHLSEVAAGHYVDGTRKIFVEGVEPKTLLLHDEPGRFRVVLNHFDRESFRLHQQAGRITPHFHHFDFATRVISGSYHHLLFDNAGELLQPRLSLRHRTRDDVDHVYVLPWDEFHCVLAPDRDTMSLQIRGPVRFQPRRPAPTLTSRDLLLARDSALGALDTAASQSSAPSAGHIPEFAHCWL
jgi:hypothetical protein